MSNYLRVNDVAKQLGVSSSAVRRYANSGKLNYSRTPSKQRIFKQEDINSFLGIQEVTDKRAIVYYVRSSDGNKKAIASQFDTLEQSYGSLSDTDYKIQDIGSGLNDKRKGLLRIFKLAKENKIKTIYITNQDRLTRFGYSYIEEIMSIHNVKIITLNETEHKTLTEELMQDFMSLVASFSGKFYRLRGYEQQKQLLKKAGETINEKTQTN